MAPCSGTPYEWGSFAAGVAGEGRRRAMAAAAKSAAAMIPGADTT